MNSFVNSIFSNLRVYLNEINGATLTGAIDVIVVEQPDGEFLCSPFHVRFGKLGVLRSREKVVDIEINGEPVDIHMKLGESGEAFFVEECLEEDVEELPDNLATSPIPLSFFPEKYGAVPLEGDKCNESEITASEDIQLKLPLPRRNSIDFTNEAAKNEIVSKFENQISDFSHRRHTDNTLERRNLSDKLQEYTTQKLRQEWAEHEEIFQFDSNEWDKDLRNVSILPKPIDAMPEVASVLDTTVEEFLSSKESVPIVITTTITGNTLSIDNNSVKEESKGKKKRRKKSQMKKKNMPRKSSSSSSVGSNAPLEGAADVETTSVSLSLPTNSSSNDEASAKSTEQKSASLLTARTDDDGPINEEGQRQQLLPPTIRIPERDVHLAGDESPISEDGRDPPETPSKRTHDLDIHFFSDTEITTPASSGTNARNVGRSSTPVQSDSELEISLREKDTNVESTASWKWGELPTPEHTESKEIVPGDQAAQAQRNSMLSGMFNFMKTANKVRKQASANSDGGVYLSDLDPDVMDPEVAAMYFPIAAMSKQGETPTMAGQDGVEDDQESGNGTSLPRSPSSIEGQKSLDSDYEDGKPQDPKYLDFVAMSLCGFTEKGYPTDDEFNRHLIKHSDVCANPSLFSSPNLIVRLNGKYYNWAAACPIVMTIIAFQKPLSNDAVEQLITNTKHDETIVANALNAEKNETGEIHPSAGAVGPAGQAKRSWWYWRRSQATEQGGNNNNDKIDKIEDKDGDQNAVATQTTRPNSPDVSDNTLSKTDSTLNAENTSAQVENLEDLSQTSSENAANKNERYKKSLRLSSEAIKKLNLKDGMNEIEFSVTTAYQGTTRCKCCLFRWKHNDKVVISDIDGTITKSDVLGHLLPMVGKDWAQLGVAQLFSKIEQNGYKLLYLSARAIGQSRVTREYLRSIRQGDVRLPDGPLLLNPTSLLSAFHREVIERKPEQFKIACLTDIRDLFPNKDPFYAGYGNRINDVWAYRAVGIPIMRIFTINTKGELKHELTQTFQSSGYINQSLEVDEYFPALDTNEYEYRTDIFDDDEEDDELIFSETDDNDSDDYNNDLNNVNDGEDDDDDVYNDDYADVDEGDGLIIDGSNCAARINIKVDISTNQRWFLNPSI